MLRPPPPFTWGANCELLVGSRVEAEAHSRNEPGQVPDLASVEGQVLDLGPGDDLADACVLGVDERGFGDDGHVLGAAGDRQLEVEAGGHRYVDGDALPRLTREAGQVGLDLVLADGQPGQQVGSGGIRRGRPRKPGAQVGGGHRDSGQGKALLVRRVARERSRRALRKGRDGHQHGQQCDGDAAKQCHRATSNELRSSAATWPPDSCPNLARAMTETIDFAPSRPRPSFLKAHGCKWRPRHNSLLHNGDASARVARFQRAG